MGHGVLALLRLSAARTTPAPCSHPRQGDGNSPVSELEGLREHVHVGHAVNSSRHSNFKILLTDQKKYIY